MAYISAKEVKVKRDALKAKFPGVKFSVVCEHHSSVRCSIMESPFEFPDNHMSINHYPTWIKEHHAGKDYLDFLVEVSNILMHGEETVSYDSDYGSIPNFYVTMQIGQWDKPHVTNKNIKL